MKHTRLLLPLLIWLLAIAGHPALAATKWLRADTHNFIIYSSGNRDQLQKFALNVERFDALLRLQTNIKREDAPNRLTIYMLARSDDVADMFDGRRFGLAGVYLRRSEGSFAISNREASSNKFVLSGNATLLHEYSHHFMFRYFNAPYPAWYTEGFAEFVSTAAFKDTGEWTLGTPPYYRANGLFLTTKPSIESLLFSEAIRRNLEETDAFYGRAWLLTHMLSLDPTYAGKLTQYLNAIIAGKSNRDAATDTFGNLKALDKAMDQYLNKKKISALVSAQAIATDGEIAIAELDPVASQIIELGLKRRTGKELTQTRDALRRLITQAPNDANAWYELAMAEIAAGSSASPKDETKGREKAEKQVGMNESQSSSAGNSIAPDGDSAAQMAARQAASVAAMAAVDHALAADPNHVRANVLKANLMIATLHDNGDDDPAKWRTARSHIIRANRSAPLDPVPLAAWHQSFVKEGRPPIKSASEGLALAFSLAPEVNEYRVSYAFDLARLGQFDKAIALVKILANDPHDSEYGGVLLEQVRKMQAQAAKDGTKPE